MAIEFEDEFMEDAEFAALEAVQNLSSNWDVHVVAKCQASSRLCAVGISNHIIATVG
jgi:hypothetical protein